MLQTLRLSRDMQDALLLQLYDLAQRIAREWIPLQRRDDVVHEFALRCLERLRAGTWTAPAFPLERFVELRLLDRKANSSRTRRRAARRDAEHLLMVSAASHEWMSQEFWTEELRLREFSDGVRARLPRKAVRAHRMLRDDGMSYREVAKKLRVKPEDIHGYVKEVHERFRQELPAIGIEPAMHRRGGGPSNSLPLPHRR